jgi:Holliday junction resolvasome RuvABC endonuclease subunit
MRGGILGLDLAGRTGWCYVDAAGFYVASGHFKLTPATPLGGRVFYLRQKISDLATERTPDWIAIEKPIHNGGRTGLAVARALYSYAAAAEEVAYLHEIGFMEFARSTCCKVILGSGRAKKPDAVAFARRLKPSITSEDEADSILVGLTCHRHRVGEVS